jgi:RimJ/RimL family protein N-acetyltransferase
MIGFHGRPDGQGRAEIGYEIFEPYRRRGYAREAVRGLLAWATRRHGVRRFLAAIAPDNEASMQLALGLGFRQVGAQVDESDGVELVFELVVPGP